MKHALISGQIYLNEDGSTDIEILTKIDNDNRITDIFDDVDHALLEQLEPNFESTESYFFIAFVESEFVTYNTQEGSDYVVEHDVTELKSFKDLPKAIVSNEPPSIEDAAAVEGILTEEELKEPLGDVIGLYIGLYEGIEKSNLPKSMMLKHIQILLAEVKRSTKVEANYLSANAEMKKVIEEISQVDTDYHEEDMREINKIINKFYEGGT